MGVGYQRTADVLSISVSAPYGSVLSEIRPRGAATLKLWSFFFFFLNRNQFVMQSVQLQSYAKRSERSSDVLSWWERTGVTNHKWCVWKSTLAQQKEPIIEFLLTFTLGVSSPSWLLWVLPMHTAHCTHRPTLPPHPPFIVPILPLLHPSRGAHIVAQRQTSGTHFPPGEALPVGYPLRGAQEGWGGSGMKVYSGDRTRRNGGNFVPTNNEGNFLLLLMWTKS